VDGCFFDCRVDSDECELPDPAAVPALPAAVVETDLQFYARRAWEESRLAKQASTAQAAAAHSYLAAAYSAQVAKELAKTAEMDELLLSID
jgi:hypothetical protein